VPDTATAVILTVTATNATRETDVRVFPRPAADGAAAPEVSALTLRPTQVVPNLVVVKVGRDGFVRLQVSAGSADLIADLSGWYDTAGGGALFHVLAPERLLDTRLTPRPKVGPGGVVDVPVTARAGVPVVGATAVVLNVTGVEATRATDIAAYPTPDDGTSIPEVSNLNLAAGQTAADLAVVKIGSPDLAGRGQVRLRNNTGEVGLLADIAGWFGP
jgi:hypothetical protein